MFGDSVALRAIRYTYQNRIKQSGVFILVEGIV